MKLLIFAAPIRYRGTMKFSVGGLLGKRTPVQEGPNIVSRPEFGAEFSIGYGESAVLDNLMVTSLGAEGGRLQLSMKAGERSGTVELVPSQNAVAQHDWFEYAVSASLGQDRKPRVVVKRLCQNARPTDYGADFRLKTGECASFEHGMILRNRSVSRSRQGEFTNVVLELEHAGRKQEATLVSFAKGKEKFVFSGSRNSASFGPFSVRLNGASENEASLLVNRSAGLL